MSLEIKGKQIFINGNKIKCPFDSYYLSRYFIRDGNYIIFFHHPYLGKSKPQNILCYTPEGKLKWRVEDPCGRRRWSDWFTGRRPQGDFFSDFYEADGKICATVAIGYDVVINPEDGTLSKRYEKQQIGMS